MGPVKSSRTWSSRTFTRRFHGTFCLYTEMSRRPFFFNKNRNVLEIVCENKTSKIVGKLVEKLRISQTNGTVVHKFLTFSELLKSLGNICFLEQLSKKSLSAPVENRVFNSICHQVICCSSLWQKHVCQQGQRFKKRALHQQGATTETYFTSAGVLTLPKSVNSVISRFVHRYS